MENINFKSTQLVTWIEYFPMWCLMSDLLLLKLNVKFAGEELSGLDRPEGRRATRNLLTVISVLSLSATF